MITETGVCVGSENGDGGSLIETETSCELGDVEQKVRRGRKDTGCLLVLCVLAFMLTYLHPCAFMF